MSNYDDTNRFALFPNDRMREGRSDPDLQGFINIDGKEYWFSGWTNYNRNDTVKCITGVIGDERERREQTKQDNQQSRRGPGPKRGGNEGSTKSQRR